jgi:hypothetical protein
MFAVEHPEFRGMGTTATVAGVLGVKEVPGKPVVQSAWCPHLGADLSVGQIVDGSRHGGDAANLRRVFVHIADTSRLDVSLLNEPIEHRFDGAVGPGLSGPQIGLQRAGRMGWPQ